MNRIFLFLMYFFLSLLQLTTQQLLGMELDCLQKKISCIIDQIKHVQIDLRQPPCKQEESLDQISMSIKNLSALTKHPHKYLAGPIPNPTQIKLSLCGFFHQLYKLDGNHLVYTFKNGNLALFNTESKRFSSVVSGHTDIINAVIKLQNGNIATASKDKTIKIWDHKSGNCILTLTGHKHQVRSLLQLASGAMASASWDRTIKIWNPETGKCLATIERHSRFINTLFPLKNGNFISIDDKTMHVWDSATFECLHSFKEKCGWIHSLIELRNGNIAFATGDHVIKIYNLESEDLVQVFMEHNCPISHVIELQNGKFASASSDGYIKIWDPEIGFCERTISVCSSLWITALIELSCSGLIAVADKNGSIKTWSVKTGDAHHDLFGHTGHIYQIWQLDDGNIVSSSDDAPIIVWDLYPEKLRSLFTEPFTEATQNTALLAQLQKHAEEYALTTEYAWEQAMQRVYEAYGYSSSIVTQDYIILE